MKPRIYRRPPLNMPLWRARTAGGFSKQNSHPLYEGHPIKNETFSVAQ